MSPLLRSLVIVAAVVLAAPFLVLMFIVGQLLPLPSTLIAIALVGTVAVWLWLRKSRDVSVAGSESGLMGRQSSKEGLL